MTVSTRAFAALLFVATAGGMVVLLSCGGPYAHEAKVPGTVLLYEDADVALGGGTQGNLKSAVAVLNRRFTGRLEKIAHAELRSPQQISVHIVGFDPDIVREVEWRTEAIGMIEFRVLANRYDHASIIQEARKRYLRDVRGKDGQLTAEWVPVASQTEAALAAEQDLVSRLGRIGDTKVLEVLVINDVHNLNGRYLEQVEPGVDRLRKPCLVLHWNRMGSRRLASLTGDNLPDRERGITRRLGIILDKMLCAASPIDTKLSDTIAITGSFQERHLDAMAAILNGGSLPVRLGQVAKRTTAEDDAVARESLGVPQKE